MTSDNPNQLAVAVLMLSLISAMAVVIFSSFLALIYVRRRGSDASIPSGSTEEVRPAVSRYRPSIFDNACRWLVIKSNNVASVQSALGLHNPVPCTWDEGLAHLAPQKLFISSPVQGWILVIGQGLPDPSEDVDRCFHFILKMSRSLGQVQMFSLNRTLHHHAWVWAEAGQVRRAYCWAGETLWNQGDCTPAENEVGLHCLAYGEVPEQPVSPVEADAAASKVFLLAARWSVDPTAINENAPHLNRGVAGDLISSKSH